MFTGTPELGPATVVTVRDVAIHSATSDSTQATTFGNPVIAECGSNPTQLLLLSVAFEHCGGFFQIRCIEAFPEPAMGLGEHLPGLGLRALLLI